MATHQHWGPSFSYKVFRFSFGVALTNSEARLLSKRVFSVFACAAFKLFCICFSSLPQSLPLPKGLGSSKGPSGLWVGVSLLTQRDMFLWLSIVPSSPSPCLLFSPGILSFLECKQSTKIFPCLTLIHTPEKESQDIEESDSSIKVVPSPEAAIPRSIVHTKDDSPNRPQLQTRRVTWALWLGIRSFRIYLMETWKQPCVLCPVCLYNHIVCVWRCLMTVPGLGSVRRFRASLFFFIFNPILLDK